MNAVSKGNLRTRISNTDMDRDSQQLADGFNLMMNEIDVLLGKVKKSRNN